MTALEATEQRFPIRFPLFDKVHFTNSICEPQSTAEAVERVSTILDAICAPVSPDQTLDNSANLTDAQEWSLKPIPCKHIKLSDRTLDKWKQPQPT